MCACTCRRKSAIIFCADFESNWVSVNDVRPCTIVAASTLRTMGVSSCVWRFPITLSMKYFVEAGSTSPQTRLTAISKKPSASRPRRGRISAQMSGRAFQTFLRFSFLLSAWESFSLAMGEGSQSAWMRRVLRELYTRHLANRAGCGVKVKDGRREELIGASAAARSMRRRRALNVQDAADEFAQGDAQMSPQAPLQAGVILRAAERSPINCRNTELRRKSCTMRVVTAVPRNEPR